MSISEFRIWCDTHNIKNFVVDNNEHAPYDLVTRYCKHKNFIVMMNVQSFINYCNYKSYGIIEIRNYPDNKYQFRMFRINELNDFTHYLTVWTQSDYIKMLEENLNYVKTFNFYGEH